jgi:hypothetical protein
MKISTNIQSAQANYPFYYHVVNSNEVHSFENFEDALEDYEEAKIQEEKFNTGFTPIVIEPKLAVIYANESNIYCFEKKDFSYFRGNVDESSYAMPLEVAEVIIKVINQERQAEGLEDAFLCELPSYFEFN